MSKPTSGLAQSILDVRGLSHRYGAADIFSDVDFTLDAGTVTFLTGSNGAGKSTLFRCLAGWSPPRSGSMLLCGTPFDGASRAQRKLIAYVPDVPTFYDDLTAIEHLRFMRRANNCLSEEREADQLMQEFGLASYRDQFPSSYSRGMRQKRALVLALSIHPRLFLLDEPYGPLDRNASMVLSAFLDKARAEGSAVLVSCHHDVPRLIPDQILHLEEGKIFFREPDRFCEESVASDAAFLSHSAAE